MMSALEKYRKQSVSSYDGLILQKYADAAMTELEAALAERDRMLRTASIDRIGSCVCVTCEKDRHNWLADLRALAEEED